MTKYRLSRPPTLSFYCPELSTESPDSQPRIRYYMPQLDALRAFAVLAVMFQHFYGSHVGIDLPIGEWGVQLFFVLSGFLITGILLDCRGRDDNPNREQRKLQLRRFYIRRALRILPLFYLVVLGAALVNIRPIRENLIWHLTYTTNIMLAMREDWSGPASHLWSLAVEEQFYLVWPWLILWLPSKYLKPAILGIIAIAPLYQIGGYFVGLGPIALSVSTLSCLDALGIGALLAFYRKRQPESFEDSVHSEWHHYFGFVSLFCALLSWVFWEEHYFVQVAGTLAAILFFCWLIHRAAVGFTGWPGRVMRWKPLIYLGQISYGLYIFHKFISIVMPHVFSKLRLPYPENPILQAILLIGINIALASCSWFWFERPINKLKNRFNYQIN